MNPDELSLASLFHSGFRVRPAELVLHMILNNEIRPLAERALLTSLLFAHHEAELPEVTEEEIQQAWDVLRYALDYSTKERVIEFLGELGIAPEELLDALEKELRVQKYVDARIARLAEDPESQEATLWQTFLDATLRPRIIRASSIALLDPSTSTDPAAGGQAAGDAAQLETAHIDAARSRFLSRHRETTWPSLEDKLTVRWKVKPADLERMVHLYARALASGPR